MQTSACFQLLLFLPCLPGFLHALLCYIFFFSYIHAYLSCMFSLDIITEIFLFQVRESVISTSFEIARPTTIPSDNADHKVRKPVLIIENSKITIKILKVTVALIDLKPNLEYE